MAKIDLKDFVKYGKLFEVYGNLLSEDRQSVMTMYFDFNMTLVEIAKEKDVSRQAVLDSIEKSCQKLESFEKVLHLVQREKQLSEKLQELKSQAEKLGQDKIAEKVGDILKEI